MKVSERWTRENIAWAAGLFEGEGCISSGRAGIRLSLGMTDKDVVEKFLSIVGVGTIGKPTSLPNRKPCWYWVLYKVEHSQAVLAALWPFLGQRRRARAVELIQRWASLKPKRKHRKSCPQGHEYNEANTYHSPSGSRQCRQCKVAYKKRPAVAAQIQS